VWVKTVPRSLDQFQLLRSFATGIRKLHLRWKFGIRLDGSVKISMSSRFVTRSKGSIKVGSETYVTFKTLILTRDGVAGVDRPIRIGRRCFIGGGSMICPGVTIGDDCIIAAGSIVDCDVPSGCIAGGNPARVLQEGIEVGPYGRLAGADERSRALPR